MALVPVSCLQPTMVRANYILWMIIFETNVGYPTFLTNVHDFGTVYILI